MWGHAQSADEREEDNNYSGHLKPDVTAQAYNSSTEAETGGLL